MTKVIRRKGMIVLWGLLLLYVITFEIVLKNSHLRTIFLSLILIFSSLLVISIFWKLKYNEDSFSLKFEGIYNLEYKKIVSIVHYKSLRIVINRYAIFRIPFDKFVISYMGKSESGNEEELQKTFIKFYMHDVKMREFFRFVSEKNPAIDFHLDEAGLDGVERKAFDYF